MQDLLSPRLSFNPPAGLYARHDDSIRSYADMLAERHCRSLIWNELSPPEWSRAAGGGIRIFFQDGKSSIRTVGFGGHAAVVKMEFDDDTFLSGLTVRLEGAEPLSLGELEALKSATMEKVLDELWDGEVLESTVEADRLVVAWRGVRVALDTTTGDMPGLSLSMRMLGTA
jgi:hypothetical protein